MELKEVEQTTPGDGTQFQSHLYGIESQQKEADQQQY